MRRAELARLLERPLLLIAAAIALQWLTTLVVGLRSADFDLGARELLNVAVLSPLALAAAFVVGERLGGIALAAWTLLVWIALPWLAPIFTLASYDVTMRDDVLPLAVGLTPDTAYAEGVALLVLLALLLHRRRLTIVAGGLVLAAFVVLWTTRLPIPDLSRDAFDGAMAGLREYFWSQRVLQWLPLAGVIAIARRSALAALALGGWLGGYAVIRLAQPGVGYEDGELFRELLPAYPAYVLLASAVPLLVPTLAARLGPLARAAETPP